MFRTESGFLAWVDGLGTVEGRTLAETRREALKLIRAVVAGAFPDRPGVGSAGAEELLEFHLKVLARRPRSGSARSTVRGGPTSGR